MQFAENKTKIKKIRKFCPKLLKKKVVVYESAKEQFHILFLGGQNYEKDNFVVFNARITIYIIS